jgi:membrane-bound lytic murein transglycosylase D
MVLSASLNFDSKHQKETEIVAAFDIDPSFLQDPMLKRVQKKTETLYHTRSFFGTMDDAYLFLPLVKHIITKAGLPEEFIFLAMAESHFTARACSNKRATGIWQFMEGTGRRYGLKIDDYVDERLDLVKSTRAAVRYLSDLHDRFGKWYLAAIAYNCGEGRLSRAIKRAGTDDLKVLLSERKKYLPRESRQYMRKIVTLGLMGKNSSTLFSREYEYLLNRGKASSLASVAVSRGETLARVAKLLDMPLRDLKNLNHHLKYAFTPPYSHSYNVYIPYVKLSEFKQKYTPGDLQRMYLVHIVKPGDNLSTLGKHYRVPYKSIMDFNSLSSTRLSLKQKLIIPVKKGYVPHSERRYTVKPGDTLSSIAKTFRVSVNQLKRINQLDSHIIKIGEKLSLYD